MHNRIGLLLRDGSNCSIQIMRATELHDEDFDAMWPAEVRPAKRSVIDEAKLEPKPKVTPAPPPEVPSEPVAILKSGVVDGMAYTLYVDGSIEAELPQGTLHFASINELRDHLAKNS